MRRDVFEALAPVCPLCLHSRKVVSPLTLAEVSETRAAHVWQGVLHCSDPSCWQEYPIMDGVPIIVPDPAAFLAKSEYAIQFRADFAGGLPSLLGDAIGPGTTYDQTRQHLSIYAGSHFADWSDPPGSAGLAPVLDEALGVMERFEGSAIDIGCGVGRGTWALAQHSAQVTLGADLNLAMLRLAQRLALEGEATWERRRIGLVYDPVTVRLPAACADATLDFWAVDAMALPFPEGSFAASLAVNIVDCIPGPTNLIAETSRVLAAGSQAVFTTPYDWSSTVAEKEAWIGGHSQRSPHKGAGEPVLLETLKQYGLTPEHELLDVPWKLALHARSVMHYSLHVVGCRRAPV
jgi:SAM-dependent methyltransferase/uncharacterized protein YbaR (Trm112 family)